MKSISKTKTVSRTKTVSKKSQDSRELIKVIEIFVGKNDCGYDLMCLDVVRYMYSFVEFKFDNNTIREAVKVYFGHDKTNALFRYGRIENWNVCVRGYEHVRIVL